VNNLLGATAEEIALFESFIQRHQVFLTTGFSEITVSENSKLGYEESIVTTLLSTQKKASIERSTYAGFRYALNVLLKSLLSNVAVTDHKHTPKFKLRGVIEGFYGTPWSHEQRLRGLAHFSDFGFNRYLLAPKDDPWHRYDWRSALSEDFLNRVSDLIAQGRKNAITVAVAISPGLTVEYSDAHDVEAIMVRFKQLHSIGVREFGLFLDDIPARLQSEKDSAKFNSIMQAHSYYCNAVWAELKKLDSENTLAICPLQYHGKATEEYITEFGNALDPDLALIWTGREICSEYLDVADAKVFQANTNHTPLYWDNYPVNDVAMLNELHVGPIEGREKGLENYSLGYFANPMDRFELSLISLSTIGDYLWDTQGYEPQVSWEYSLTLLMDNSGDRAAIRNLLRGCFESCLRVNPAPDFSAMLEAASFSWKTGKPAQAAQLVENHSKQMLRDVATIKSAQFSQPQWREESLKWLTKYESVGKALMEIADILSTCGVSKNSNLSGSKADLAAINSIRASLNSDPTRIFGSGLDMTLAELADEIRWSLTA
jgi:hyaluronoglucosaminidase